MDIQTILKLSVVAIVAMILFLNPQKKNEGKGKQLIESHQLNQNHSQSQNQSDIPNAKLTNYSKNDIHSKNLQPSWKRKLQGTRSQRKLRRVPTLDTDDPKNNFRSGQLQLKEIEDHIKSKKILRVIRINGFKDNDNGGVKMDDEKALCESLGIQFYHINFYSRNAIERIDELLRMGNTLVHCKHGYDRTGAVVGYHLKQNGFSIMEIIRHNRWEDYRDVKSEKYLEDYFTKIL